MQDLFKWSLEVIRKDPAKGWMESRKEELIPLLASRINLLLEGKPFLLFCDDEREWFEEYFMKNINKRGNQRPLLPFFPLKALYANLNLINTNEGMELLNDMLDLAFPQGFIYFYIGRGNCTLSQIAKNRDDSYMWLIDDNVENSFNLSSKDIDLDIKLLNLFDLFDKSVSAVLFDEVII